MEKNILKIDIAEMLRKYEGKKCSFDLVGTSAVIETSSDLHEIDLDYTKNSHSHADTDPWVKLETYYGFEAALEREVKKEN